MQTMNTEAELFVRLAMTKLQRHGGSAIDYAAKRWGRESDVVYAVKASIAGAGTSAGSWGAELSAGNAAAAVFLGYVRPQTIVGKLEALRRVPKDVPALAGGGAVAYWTAQGKATPVSAAVFSRDSLPALKVSALIVITDELLDDSAPDAEAVIGRDLAAAAIEVEDLAFIDRANAGIAGKMPASVTHSAPTVASVGDLAEDLAAAIDAFQGDLNSAAWVLHPALAVQIALQGGGVGLAAKIGARGGELLGLPAIVSRSCELDSNGAGTIALIDGAGIAYVDDGITAGRSTQATIEMSDAPAGDTQPPTGATELVSLFQANASALLVVRRVNWKPVRAGAVVCITDANYGRVSS